jgi:S-adenosylmethionine decarboxylase
MRDGTVTGGVEWLVDAFGCDPDRLRDRGVLLELGASLIGALELHVIGEPQVHQFSGPGGITALYLLSESHLAWHTYPEHGLATLNVYCCRSRAPLDWRLLLARTLGASRVTVTDVVRGAPESAAAARKGHAP